MRCSPHQIIGLERASMSKSALKFPNVCRSPATAGRLVHHATVGDALLFIKPKRRDLDLELGVDLALALLVELNGHGAQPRRALIR